MTSKDYFSFQNTSGDIEGHLINISCWYFISWIFNTSCNILIYTIYKNATSGKGFNIDGLNLKNLRFANDIALLSDNLQDIGEMLQNLQEVCTQIGLKIIILKTKCMTNLIHYGNTVLGVCEVKLVNRYTLVMK